MPFNLPFPLTLYITGGVGLALCVVSIVLIAIFHANYKPKRIPLIMFAVGFLLFMGTGFLFWHINHLPDEEDVPIPEPVGTSVDSKLLSVSVTIPAYLLRDEDFSDFDPEEYAEKKGYKKATLNEDGSLTIKISKGDHKEKVAELLAKLEEDFAGLVGGENTPYVKFVEKTPDYHEIIITVDGEGYKEDGDATPVKVGESVVTYQVYNGDYLHSEIKVIDVKTGNTLYDAVFPDALEPGYSSPAEPESGSVPEKPEPVDFTADDLDNIAGTILAALPETYRDSEWTNVNCDYNSDGITVDLQVDQGSDDTDAALSLAADCFAIAKNTVEGRDAAFASVVITIVNDGSPLGLYITDNGKDFVIINGGEQTEVSLP